MQTLPLSGTDIVVQSKDGDLLAVVEIYNVPDLTPEKAAYARRLLLEHSRFNRAAPYFFVVSQDVGYLWVQDEFVPIDETPPTTSFSMTQIIRHYRSDLDPSNRLRPASIEIAIEKWFWDLALNPQDQPNGLAAELSTTSFIDHMRGSSINYLFKSEIER
jgi:hypothetical protein